MTSRYAILEDGQVKPVPMLEWAQWFEDADRRRVELTEIGPDVRVSTVFLGLNHGWNGADLWFETMVFASDLAIDEDRERYTTLLEARVGHAAMVERVKAAIRGEGEDASEGDRSDDG